VGRRTSSRQLLQKRRSIKLMGNAKLLKVAFPYGKDAKTTARKIGSVRDLILDASGAFEVAF
jgi:hypothetical protein